MVWSSDFLNLLFQRKKLKQERGMRIERGGKIKSEVYMKTLALKHAFTELCICLRREWARMKMPLLPGPVALYH